MNLGVTDNTQQAGSCILNGCELDTTFRQFVHDDFAHDGRSNEPGRNIVDSDIVIALCPSQTLHHTSQAILGSRILQGTWQIEVAGKTTLEDQTGILSRIFVQ